MPTQKIEFHPDAVVETAQARQWYSEIDDALGDSYADEVDNAIEKIAASPQRWPIHLHGTRAFLLHRFPFLVVYRVVDEVVQVIAVQHAKRRPGYWQHRISK